MIPATEEVISKLPTYCFLEVLGGVQIDLFELDPGRGSVCQGCGLRTFRASDSDAHAPQRYVPVPGTWDGSDWCEWRNLVNASPLCSRKVIDLAARLRWTNFLFGESLPGVSTYSPVPEDWFPNVAARVRQLHPDLFVRLHGTPLGLPMYPFLKAVLIWSLSLFSAHAAGAEADRITIHIVHPNSTTICTDEPVTPREGYRLMQLAREKGTPKRVLVGKETLFSDRDLKKISISVSSISTFGCELHFDERVREKLLSTR